MNDDVFLKPPVHGRVANWLGPRMVERLLEFAQSQQVSFYETDVWNNAKGAREIDLTARRSWKIKDLGSLRSDIQERARALMPNMCTQLGTARFEPRRFEIEMVAHCDGAFFGEHRDRNPQSPARNRRISAVYYFHHIPKSFSGGALRIYPIAGSKQSTAFVEIEPINDTLVFFPSWFPHEVLPVKCPSRRFEDSRFAINCWVHC
jgi:SM-20-related protein